MTPGCSWWTRKTAVGSSGQTTLQDRGRRCGATPCTERLAAEDAGRSRHSSNGAAWIMLEVANMEWEKWWRVLGSSRRSLPSC